jgi:trimeric autotransporter adhesin
MKNITVFLLKLLCLIFVFGYANKTIAQISGNVYWDINNNGSKSAAGIFPFEKGVYAVTVRAYNSSNTLLATATTNAIGDYSMASVTSFPVRLEFQTAADVCAAKPGVGNNSNVQFITATTNAANFGIINQVNYAINANPYVASNAYTNGNALATGIGEAGLRQNLLVFPYALDNTTKTGTNYQNQWLGSIFGLTFQKETRTLLMAAYLKRHASFGPGGMDAIYKTTVSTAGDASQPTILCNLTTLGINVGTNPRSVALPNLTSSPNIDLGVFGQVGKVGIGNIDMAENGKDLYVTNLFQNRIHRINIGLPIKNTLTATDVTGTWTIPGPGLASTEWHIMSVKCFEGMIYVGGITSKQRTDAPSATLADLTADQVNLRAYVYSLNTITGVITEVLQVPLNYRRGNILNQYRYEYKTNWWRAWQNNGDADVLRNDFNDGYEVFPQPFAPYNTGNNTGIIYPQPMLSDIEFDSDGAMILGLRDRFGDQAGVNNYMEGVNGNVPTTGGQYFRVFACGEILRAGKNGAAWSIENNGIVMNNGQMRNANLANVQGTPPVSANTFSGTYNPMSGSPWGWDAATNGFGPGGRYYYYNQAFDATGVPTTNLQSGAFVGSTVHYNKSYGGLAIMPGNDEIMLTALSPEGRPFSSGVLRLSNDGLATGTNAGNMTDQQELIPGSGLPTGASNDPTGFGKANGIGDVEILSEAMPIEIGNRVWLDANSNGLQDANENGVANVSITLRSPGADGTFGNGDDQTWSTTTDAGGHYYFNNSNVNDNRKIALNFIGLTTPNSGILNAQNYRLELDLAQSGTASTSATYENIANDNIDSDATYGNLVGVGNRSYINVNTSNNNYDFDFGMKPSIVLANEALTLKVTLLGNNATLNWQTQEALHADKFMVEKSNANNFTAFAEKLASTQPSGTVPYVMEYNIANEAAGSVLFRVKLISKDGSEKYSNIVSVKKYNKFDMQVAPNPVKNELLVNIFTEKDAIVQVKIINVNGAVVLYKNNVALLKGSNQINIDGIKNLLPGSYVVQIDGVNGKLNNRTIIKE